MNQFLILSKEQRLQDAIKGVIDVAAADVSVSATVEDGKQKLIETPFGVVFIDFETVRPEGLDAFVALNDLCLKNSIEAVMIVRNITPQIQKVKKRFDAFQTIVETTKGRDPFNNGLRTFIENATSSGGSSFVDENLGAETDLPSLDASALSQFGVPDLIFSIWTRRATGVININDGRDNRFSFREGEFVIADDTLATSDLYDILSTVSASYSFTRADRVSGTRKSTLNILIKGIVGAVSKRHAMDKVIHVGDQYPVITNLWEERSQHYSKLNEMVQLIEKIDGQTRWNDIVSSLGEKYYQVAFLAMVSRLVLTSPSPRSGIVNVTWSRSVREARDREDQKKVQSTKAFRATSDDRSALERELRHLLKVTQSQTPHEIFGVWEGCGRKVVSERFYELVKEHHPDVYGGNTSGKVKTLVQDTFILIKDAYAELSKIEKAQTVDPPAGWVREPSVVVSEIVDDPEPLEIGRRHTTGVSLELDDSEPEKLSAEEVRAKMERLSSVRKKRARRKSLPGKQVRKTTPSATLEMLTDSFSEVEVVETPEEIATRERNEKLAALKRNAVAASGKDPGMVSWESGFSLYREGKLDEAFPYFSAAYEANQSSAPIMAFYGYVKWKLDPTNLEECENLVRDAINKNHKQSMPDSILFLAHMLNARGETKSARRFYERALALNPQSREAERELRLLKMREGRTETDPGALIKNLFKK